MAGLTLSTGTAETAVDDGRELLQHFPNNRRAYVANAFLYAVRAGARTPLQVLIAVNHTLEETRARALRWSQTSDTAARSDDLYGVLHEHHDEAMAFARWALAWEALPQAERDRIKAEKGAVYRQAYMEQQPATDKQVAYLRALGYQGEVTSKAHASELIDQLQRDRQGGSHAN